MALKQLSAKPWILTMPKCHGEGEQAADVEAWQACCWEAFVGAELRSVIACGPQTPHRAAQLWS
jgi:hypothetical protein